MAKKIKRILLTLAIFVFLLNACGKKDEKKDPKDSEIIVSLLMDKFGTADGSINSKAYRGLLDLNVDTQIKIDYEVSKSDDDFEDSIEKLVKKGSKLIWGAGSQTSDAIKEASYNYKDVRFATLDNIYDDSSMPKNLTGTIFNTEESSYILGYVAGLTTKTNKVAYLGGEKGILSDKNEFGFKAGVYDAAKERKLKINVNSEYIGNFYDLEKGRALAKELYESGIDIIFADCGSGTLGAIDEAKDQDKFLMVTEEALIKEAPDNILLASIKDYEEAINTISSKFIAKNDIGKKNFELGFVDNCLSISPYDKERKLFNSSVYDKAMNKKKDISSGKKEIPYNQTSFEKFTSSNKSK